MADLSEISVMGFEQSCTARDPVTFSTQGKDPAGVQDEAKLTKIKKAVTISDVYFTKIFFITFLFLGCKRQNQNDTF